jgi:pimeloyl-ACP methyl ester carboxylesterase
MSDRVEGVPTLETRMDDVRAVMDAAGSEKAAILGASEGGPMSTLFAATYPGRCWALVLFGTYASQRRAPDYPWAESDEEFRASIEELPSGGRLKTRGQLRRRWLRARAKPTRRRSRP